MMGRSSQWGSLLENVASVGKRTGLCTRMGGHGVLAEMWKNS
jgi:hypothetical protein